MAVSTYTLLDSVTLASSAASVTFSSIDQSYGDLILVAEAKSDSLNSAITLRLNGDTGSNYSNVNMFGNGSTAGSYSTSGSSIELHNYNITTANQVLIVATVMDYSATDKHKSVLSRGNVPATGVSAIAGRWANTSAVTALNLVFSNDLAAGSTFHLYGIEA